MQSFGQCVTRVACLFDIQRHINGLRLAAPLAVHLAAGQLLLEPILVDAQQEGGKGQDWRVERSGDP